MAPFISELFLNIQTPHSICEVEPKTLQEKFISTTCNYGALFIYFWAANRRLWPQMSTDVVFSSRSTNKTSRMSLFEFQARQSLDCRITEYIYWLK